MKQTFITKVVNKDSAPVAGIKVSCQIFTDPAVASTLTAKDGSFSISGTGIGPMLTFEDIDGPENGGEYEDKTQEITVSQMLCQYCRSSRLSA